MRQVGVIAAAGLVALEQVVPKLDDDHARTKRIAEAIHHQKSSNFIIDLDSVQTNIFMIQIRNEKIRSSDLMERFRTVTEQEIKDGIVDENSKGIIVKSGSRDWSFVRLVLYLQITDKLVDLAIKKILYVLNEFDRKFK